MALITRQNQYRGLNAHLHSYLQSKKGDWENFHFQHILHINEVMMDVLEPLGYTASSQQSLQIRLANGEHRYPESDVTLYDPDLQRAAQPRAMASSPAHAYVMPLETYISMVDEDTLFYRAVAIYPLEKEEGRPVAWLELLSPSNKPTKSGYRQYAEKRLQILLQGIVFIEVDYLHETPPISPSLPGYAQRGRQPDNDAYPYRVSVSVPRPTLSEGETVLYQFSVDDVLPQVNMPLSGTDQIIFDFSMPYAKTFYNFHYGKKVDYTQLPVNFHLYSEMDQLRILRRMLTVIKAAEQGQDVSQPPLPLADAEISLEEAMRQWELLQSQDQ